MHATNATWQRGLAPVAVVMISLNEGHNMEAVLTNLKGWAQEVFLVDSYSKDNSVEIALRHGVHVVQRRFRGFGNQWDFALATLPITAPWTMKLDPDERISAGLKAEILAACTTEHYSAYYVDIKLYFMRRPLPVHLHLVRLWRTGAAKFSDVLANEHAIIDGKIGRLRAVIEHHDSPDMDHWLEKQNRYTTAEAVSLSRGLALSAKPALLGTRLQRRMWAKKHFYRVPFRYLLLFIYYWLWRGSWRVGWVGYAWARLRSDVMRMVEYKVREIETTGQLPASRLYGAGQPDPRVPQYD